MLKTHPFFLVIFVVFRSLGQDQSIITTSRNTPVGIISYASAVTSSGFETGKYVDGYVKKYGTNRFIYPVGNAGLYRPFAAEANETFGAYYRENPAISSTGNEVTGGPFSNIRAAEVGKVSTSEFWDINGINPTKITLTWTASSNLGTLLNGVDTDKILLVGFDGEKWVKIPAIIDVNALLGGISSVTSGSITTTEAFAPDSYQVYTLGAVPDAALPVTLVSFKALPEEKKVFLEWVTSEETNHDQFEIERFAINNLWATIGALPGNGLSGHQGYSFIDDNPRRGENLYRLKMIDFDGSFTHSQIRSVQIDVKLDSISFFPNPVTDLLYIQGIEESTVSEITIHNLMGKEVLKKTTELEGGVNVSHLSSGIYVVKYRNQSGEITTDKVVIAR